MHFKVYKLGLFKYLVFGLNQGLMILLYLFLNPSFIYYFILIVGHKKPRLFPTKSRIYKALALVLITERLVNSHTYNKTFWVTSDDYLETF